LSILIKKESGLTVQECCRMRTITEAKIRLSGTTDSLHKIADGLGFCNATQFGTFFKKHTGQTPMEYRKGIGM
jgi:two-component system response regulator YesN